MDFALKPIISRQIWQGAEMNEVSGRGLRGVEAIWKLCDGTKIWRGQLTVLLYQEQLTDLVCFALHDGRQMRGVYGRRPPSFALLWCNTSQRHQHLLWMYVVHFVLVLWWLSRHCMNVPSRFVGCSCGSLNPSGLETLVVGEFVSAPHKATSST